MEVNQFQIIIGEVHNVVAVMRLNSRWAPGPNSHHVGVTESPLLQAFKNLRRTLDQTKEFNKLDTIVYLTPFLNIIQSEEANGPITGVALSSVWKFLSYGFINTNSPNVHKTIYLIAESVTHCRFEATGPESDEIVLMRILRVLLACLRCPVGQLISDDLVNEMLHTCYRMSIQLRLSALLRRTAEQTLIEMLQTIFYEKDFEKSIFNRIQDEREPIEEGPTVLSNPSSCLPSEGTEEVPQKGYGLKCLYRVLRFVCSLVNPGLENSTEAVKHLGLRLLNIILETSSAHLANWPQLLGIIQDDLCKYLLQNLKSDNLVLLTHTFRAFIHVLSIEKLKKHLKLQAEVFFNNLLALAHESSKLAQYERQELAVECILEFCRQPGFLLELYVNYDCSLHCTNLFENLCKFFYKNAFPVNGALYTVHVLCLEGLLTIIESLSQPNDLLNPPAQINPEEIRKNKQTKNLLFKAAEVFNKSEKEGLEFLKNNNIIENIEDPMCLAKFLKNTPYLDKTVIGRLLGKPDEFNVAVLKEYTKLFDFSTTSFDYAIRTFLQSFLMPGEAQIVQRILDAFANHYYNSNPGPFGNAEATFLLAYSVMILHVSVHHKDVKAKMSPEDYFKTVAGTNDKKDFPRDMLERLYQSIVSQEIKIPDDSPSGEITKSKWRDLLTRAPLIGSFTPINSFVQAFDKDLFSVIKGPVISAIVVVFETTADEPLMRRALDGFERCAEISARFNMTDVFDNLIITLCKNSTLTSPSAVRENGSTIFGRNVKARLATETAFSITHKYGDHLRESWQNILTCIVTMYKLDLLPALTDLPEFSINSTTRSVKTPSSPQTSTRSSLLSSFGILGTAGWFGSDAEEPSQADLQAQKLTADCVRQCNIPDLVTNTKILQIDSLIYLIKALILGSVVPQQSKQKLLIHDPASIFYLELLTIITLMNQDRLILIWVLVNEHFLGIIRSATPFADRSQLTPLVKKAVSLLLTLCTNLVQIADLSEKVIPSLEIFTQLPHPVVDECALILARGFVKLLDNAAHIKSKSSWNTVLGLGLLTLNNSNALNQAFPALYLLVSTPEKLTLANFYACLRTVITFARSRLLSHSSVVEAIELLNNLYAFPMNFLVPVSSKASLASMQITDETLPAKEDGYEFLHPFTEEQVWEDYWQPVLDALCQLCRDRRFNVRNYSMTILQRCLLSPYLRVLSSRTWGLCFHQIIFPLLEQLLEPFPDESLTSVEETRLRASFLLSKIFLQYLPRLTLLPEFHKLWLQILRFIELYMKADHSDLLAEALPEALKNILLVMSASGVLTPPDPSAFPDPNPSQNIWGLTWATIDQLSPSLKEEILHKVAPVLIPNYTGGQASSPVSGSGVTSGPNTRNPSGSSSPTTLNELAHSSHSAPALPSSSLSQESPLATSSLSPHSLHDKDQTLVV